MISFLHFLALVAFVSASNSTQNVTDFLQPTVVTQIVTQIVTVFLPAPTPSPTAATRWTTPPYMSDLSPFNITYFPSGQRNVALEPASSTLLRLVYPAHSVNPSTSPTGGADFYATPLDLSGAHTVSLVYAVFFPADFDWVKGGKLPGLFGGHTGCSGGSAARDCFSTRLMWRAEGVGELYLYAPKDKQSKALCADVNSVCDNTYGLSIGRGNFRFTPGNWTRLEQRVVLNTPGQTDGAFTLYVDHRPVINRTDMFYRDVAQPAEFLGLFFSTFFGGHGKQYATPKQQYTWFKDFAITRHD